MKSLSLNISLALLLAFSSLKSANADLRCPPKVNAFGNKTCFDSQGNSWLVKTDLSGNEFWRDNKGNTMKVITDSFGNKTYLDGSGKTRLGTKDTHGNETWHTPNGGTVKGRSDQYGNTYYKDSSGKRAKCYTDISGNKLCGRQ